MVTLETGSWCLSGSLTKVAAFSLLFSLRSLATTWLIVLLLGRAILGPGSLEFSTWQTSHNLSFSIASMVTLLYLPDC